MTFFSPSSWGSREARTATIAQCGRCGLSKGCYSPRMEVSGEGSRKILFVAEAPGEEEDRQGVQLIGDSGQLLRRVLNGIGEELDDGWKTNSIICRPPKNKMSDEYIECCRPNLLNTIKKLQPKVIVLLGMSAVKALISQEWKKDMGNLTKWEGWAIPSKTYNAWLCPTYHPSFIVRSKEDPLLMKLFRDHLKRVFPLERTMMFPYTLQDLESRVEIVLNAREARLRLRDLAGKTGELAFDYETTGLKPEHPDQQIVSCSFCLGGEETWACPIDERSLKLLSPILRSRKLFKIASNLKFEERWTRAKLGHGVREWKWDTMLAAHVLDNRRGITSIKFQAYIHLGIADYNSHIEEYLRSDSANGLNRIRELDVKELLLYNGLDSFLEYQIAKRQMEDMIPL